ncbi:MAG: energy-coupling factor ABC transporter ATP-binding protein [Candidatus Pristimantibacillus lignocellulolyticus]|uniref:Energy-coupling factor ABC transporter ATP-binding protein n=1 Tax=Candidatus Pristimantibacillus lignocellulolyticus TaxID=2994561 RepID=A0A9J6ZAE5_9BACL|nr:MAG: energy-coupling factor ABC transporter ATP-binding protein [Candidatus Pristimantibacillus lignocellulolyticus]
MSNIAVSVEQLRLKFSGEPNLIFQDFSIHIPEGQKILILGPSGSGKSTLLQVLSGIIPNYSSVPMSYASIQTPEHWGFVFQDPDTQFCMSYVDEELAFVLENRQIARELMEPAMHHVLDVVGLQLPSLHTPIRNLSQGMKQRLALAAVLLLEPRTVFLDEPSALLDPEGKHLIWESLRKSLQKHTVIVVEHHVDGILDWFDRVVILNESGVIVADDTPSSIFETQQQLLLQYGIWYPNIWHTYLSKHQSSSNNYVTRANTRAIIELEQFIGSRGGRTLIRVEQATITEGAWIAITGANGAGKSSLLLALARLIDSSGQYKIYNQTLTTGKARKTTVPQHISFVFQSPELQFVADTVYDELHHSYKLASAQPNDNNIKGKQQQERTAHEDDKQTIQNLFTQFRLNMPLDRHPFECSVGQKRRLSILTAMVEQRPILLLDEPTFGQDAANTFTIIEELQKMNAQGITIIMITHDPIIASLIASEEWHITDGRLQSITINERLAERGGTDGQCLELVRTI